MECNNAEQTLAPESCFTTCCPTDQETSTPNLASLWSVVTDINVVGTPVVLAHNGRVDVFYQRMAEDNDRRLTHKWRLAGSSEWSPNAGASHGDDLATRTALGFAAISRKERSFDIIVKGEALSSLFHIRCENGVWNTPAKVDTPNNQKIIKPPVLVSWGPDRVDLIVVADDMIPWHTFLRRVSGSFGQWISLGTGKILGNLGATSWGPGRIDVAARGTDNQIYHQVFENDTWNGWGLLGRLANGVPTTGDVTIVSGVKGLLAIYCIGGGTGRVVQSKTWGDGWHPKGEHTWSVLDGPCSDGIVSAVAYETREIDIAIRGGAGEVLHNYWNGTRWQRPVTDWSSIGGPEDRGLTGPPIVSPAGHARLEIFGRGADNRLWLMRAPVS